MALDRRDSVTAIPLLEKRLKALERGDRLNEKELEKVRDLTEQNMYRVDISATNGSLIYGDIRETTLVAMVTSWDADVTDHFIDADFIWTRNSGKPPEDNEWNLAHYTGRKQITVTAEDVGEQSTFSCIVNDHANIDAEGQIIVKTNSKLDQTIEWIKSLNPFAHIKYSMNADGVPFYDNPSDMTEPPKYLGIAYTDSQTPPTNASDYTWMLFMGSDGEDGEDGGQGRGVLNTARYYLLSDTTPVKPTAYPPQTWADVEPTYTEGSTKNLYYVDVTVYTDNTWVYSKVSLSSSYAAAKSAWDKANGVESDLGNLAKQVSNKVDSTDFIKEQEKISGVIQSVETIDTNIGTMQTSIGEVKKTVSEHTQTLTGISQKVEATDKTLTTIGDNLSTLTESVESVEQEITKDAIVTKVSDTFATKIDVNNIAIGGRNLVLDSDIAEESTEYGFGEMELSVPLESDTEYTFSANGRVTTGDAGKLLVVNLTSDDGTFIQTLNIAESEDITKSVTFTTPAGIEDKAVKVICYYSPQSPEGTTFNGSCTVNWVKLEKGNKPTDWTPAPEDGKNFTTESISESASSILQAAEEVTIGILKGYTTTSDLEEYKKQIENIFKVNKEGFAFEFKQLEDKLTEVGNEAVERNQFIRLENGNIIIGKSDSPIQALFTNNTLEFRYNDQTVAKFTNEVLEVRNIAVDNQVRFWTDWAIRKGGYVEGKGYNLNDVWIGG